MMLQAKLLFYKKMASETFAPFARMKMSSSAILAALIVTTILAWSIDYGDLLGAPAQRAAEITRWVCIFASYVMAFVALSNGKRIPRTLLLYVAVLTGTIFPSVISSKDQGDSLIA
ncbi:MAG TPA: hypothetical protein VN629_00285, partial [Castellaniella sp.]|nr:hypothetical protein [Castellaniella sp.]